MGEASRQPRCRNEACEIAESRLLHIIQATASLEDLQVPQAEVR